MIIKETGFQTPFDITQIGSWFICLFLLFCFYLINFPVLEASAQYGLGILFTISLVVSIGFTFRVTASNPTDPAVIESRRTEKEGVTNLQRLSKYCTICNSWVNEKSKHCMTCNRCCHGFDHHCVIVNNCIGQNNYKEFIWLITGTQITLITQVISCIYAIVLYKTNEGLFKSRLLFTNSSVSICLICISFSFSVIFLMLNGYLMIFHLKIKIIGLTTYEYICLTRKTQVKPKSLNNNQNQSSDYMLVNIDSVLSDQH